MFSTYVSTICTLVSAWLQNSAFGSDNVYVQLDTELKSIVTLVIIIVVLDKVSSVIEKVLIVVLEIPTFGRHCIEEQSYPALSYVRQSS